MNKIITSLIALAAVSTASFAAGNHSGELRDSDTYVGKYAAQVEGNTTSVNAFAAADDSQGLTNFERLNKVSLENDAGRH